MCTEFTMIVWQSDITLEWFCKLTDEFLKIGTMGNGKTKQDAVMMALERYDSKFTN